MKSLVDLDKLPYLSLILYHYPPLRNLPLLLILEVADFLEVVVEAVVVVEDIVLVSALIVMVKIISWNTIGSCMVNPQLIR